MTTVYVISAIASMADPNVGIEKGQRVYASEFHWFPALGQARWFTDRQIPVEIIANTAAFNQSRDFLSCGHIAVCDWQLLELTYETRDSPIAPEERDSVIRAQALKRLSPEERRVLGVDA